MWSTGHRWVIGILPTPFMGTIGRFAELRQSSKIRYTKKCKYVIPVILPISICPSCTAAIQRPQIPGRPWVDIRPARQTSCGRIRRVQTHGIGPLLELKTSGSDAAWCLEQPLTDLPTAPPPPPPPPPHPAHREHAGQATRHRH